MGLTHPLSVFVPFEYRPRTRSQHPVSSVASSLALIKTLPDEWYQTTTSIDVPSPQGVNGTFQPVTANVRLSLLALKRAVNEFPSDFSLLIDAGTQPPRLRTIGLCPIPSPIVRTGGLATRSRRTRHFLGTDLVW